MLAANVEPNKALQADRLQPQLAARGTADVIVSLQMPSPHQAEGTLTPSGQRQQRSAIRQVQDQLVNDLRGFGFSEKRRFRSIPYLALRVNEIVLNGLVHHPLVTGIEPDRLSRPLMDSSNPVIGSPLAWADGWDGSGYATAVLDTGVDSTHPWLTGKITSEACYSTSQDGVSESLCPGGVSSSTTAGSGLHCSGVSGCDHGTHVAGSVAAPDVHSTVTLLARLRGLSTSFPRRTAAW